MASIGVNGNHGGQTSRTLGNSSPEVPDCPLYVSNGALRGGGNILTRKERSFSFKVALDFLLRSSMSVARGSPWIRKFDAGPDYCITKGDQMVVMMIRASHRDIYRMLAVIIATRHHMEVSVSVICVCAVIGYVSMLPRLGTDGGGGGKKAPKLAAVARKIRGIENGTCKAFLFTVIALDWTSQLFVSKSMTDIDTFIEIWLKDIRKQVPNTRDVDRQPGAPEARAVFTAADNWTTKPQGDKTAINANFAYRMGHSAPSPQPASLPSFDSGSRRRIDHHIGHTWLGPSLSSSSSDLGKWNFYSISSTIGSSAQLETTPTPKLNTVFWCPKQSRLCPGQQASTTVVPSISDEPPPSTSPPEGQTSLLCPRNPQVGPAPKFAHCFMSDTSELTSLAKIVTDVCLFVRLFCFQAFFLRIETACPMNTVSVVLPRARKSL
uniref:Uncharacterized protein n=1 Tax=Panagrellus redivivus TaxID=6233 RepID=A0A7E4VC07_PANRE